jgi:hypothetical protein
VLRFPGGEETGLPSAELAEAFFLSRRVMEEGGIGTAGRNEEACAMYWAEPASRDENITTARSSQLSATPCGVKDCLPPRRFLVAFSSCDELAAGQLAEARSRATSNMNYLFQILDIPPLLVYFVRSCVSQPTKMSHRPAGQCSITISTL